MDVVDINTLFGPLPATSSDLTLDALMSLMAKHAVTAACTLSTLGLLLDPTVGNAATRAACGDHAQLLPAATLNPMQYFGLAQPVSQLVAEGFRLVRFFPDLQGWPLPFAPFRALVRELAPSGLPLMVNVSRAGDATGLERDLDGLDSPVVLANVGVDNLAEALAALREHPTWCIETSRLLAPGVLRLLVDSLGAGRVLFGTGAPAQPIASAMNTIRFAGLNQSEGQSIVADNARRLLQF